jgi:hypothetical protein
VLLASGGFELPGDVVAQHSVEGCDHLAHDGDDDDFGLFVGGGETMVKDFESRIVSASAQSCHVEHVTNWQPTTVDAAMSFEPASRAAMARMSFRDIESLGEGAARP